MEALEYRDVVQYDMVDSYLNLTLKSLSILRWFNHFCVDEHPTFKTKFNLLSMDDDLLVDLPELDAFLLPKVPYFLE